MDISYSKLCKIREIINSYDPEDYFCAPPDEYYDLVDKIVAEIESAEVESVKKVIFDVWGYRKNSLFKNSKIYQLKLATV